MQRICNIKTCNQPVANEQVKKCHKHYLRELENKQRKTKRPLVDKTRKCRVEDCERIQQTALNLCLMHYKRWRRHGTTKKIERTDNSNQGCKFCDKKLGKSGALGMCNKHYQMWKLHGDPIHVERRRLKPTRRDGYYRQQSGKHFHREVVERELGRELTSKETVHHVDLDKLNNESSNLFVCSKEKHGSIHQQLNKLAGQLVRAKVIVFEDGKYRFDF